MYKYVARSTELEPAREEKVFLTGSPELQAGGPAAIGEKSIRGEFQL